MAKGKSAGVPASGDASMDESTVAAPKSRPDVTQKGLDMIGDFRTDALHEALSRAPIEDDMLMALLVLSLAGQNVRVDSGASDAVVGAKRLKRHAARLFSEDGKLEFDVDTVRVAARSVLIDVLSCRRGISNSGVVSRIAGDAIGADRFLANMGSEDFLLCLSRQALEEAAKSANVSPRQKVRETRSALVEHFRQVHFVHASALFAPDAGEIADLMRHGKSSGDDSAEDNLSKDGGDDESATDDGAANDAIGGDAKDADPLEDEDRLPDTTDDASDDNDPVDEQDVYRIAAE